MIKDLLNKTKYKEDIYYKYYNEDYDTHYELDLEESKQKAEQYSTLIEDMKINSLIDIGCGFGSFLKKFMKINNIKNVTGTDISMPALKIAQKQIPSADFFRADSICLPFKDKQFKLATMIDLLEHVPDPINTLQEAKRIAKYILIKVPLEDNLFINTYKKFVHVDFRDIQGHINFWNSQSFDNFMEMNGLKLLKKTIVKAKLVPQPNWKLKIMNICQVLCEIYPDDVKTKLVPSEMYALYETN